MKKCAYILCLLLGLSQGLRAQDNLPLTLNSTGYYALVNNYMIDYSVGEMTAVETFGFDGNLLTQGFLQPFLITDVPNEAGEGIHVWSDMSPNDDGMGHDILQIDQIENFPVNDIQIFNRWGNLVFKLSGYDNDQNSFKGIGNTGMFLGNKELPDGTYYYILKVFIPSDSKTKRFTGFIVIKRK